MKTIAVTGGIGAGKSVVCRIIRTLGLPIFDCDSKAKAIMDADQDLMQQIGAGIHPSVLIKEDDRIRIDRKKLASIVFSDKGKLNALNRLVHDKVILLFQKEASSLREKGEKYFFFETAILYESRMDLLADEIWNVTAPKEIRILRLENRGLSPDESIARMSSQSLELKCDKSKDILNDGLSPILPQVIKLISNL